MVRQHELQIRVRYSETDAMGLLHHAAYFNYFEIGRTEMFRAQGGDYRKLEQQGHFFVVARLDCKYHAPAHFDDLLTLRTNLTRVSAVRMEHEYELFRDSALLAAGRSVLACVDREGRIQRIPQLVLDHVRIP